MRLHEKITVLADARRLTQRDMVRDVSARLRAMGREPVSTSTVHRWFNGQGVPDLYQGVAVAALLGVDAGYLADDAAESPPAPPVPEDPELRQLIANASVIGFAEANRRLLNYGVKPLNEFRDPRRP